MPSVCGTPIDVNISSLIHIVDRAHGVQNLLQHFILVPFVRPAEENLPN